MIRVQAVNNVNGRELCHPPIKKQQKRTVGEVVTFVKKR